MGVCVDCIYHKLGEPFGKSRLHGSRHQCVNEANIEKDYVTGRTRNGDCYMLNMFEECQLFDDGAQKEAESTEEETSQEIDGSTGDVSEAGESESSSGETGTGETE